MNVVMVALGFANCCGVGIGVVGVGGVVCCVTGCSVGGASVVSCAKAVLTSDVVMRIASRVASTVDVIILLYFMVLM